MINRPPSAQQREERVLIRLRIVRRGQTGCSHRFRTWGDKPGQVKCSCGGVWQGRIQG